MVVLNIIKAMLAFCFLILIHEAGHLVAAKLVGVRVEKFSIFFGKPIFSKVMGGTEYSVGWIPIGGYVEPYGMNQEIDEKDSQFTKHPWKKLFIAVAGPLMNLITAFLLLTVVTFNVGGYPSLEINGFSESSPAKEAGIVSGDTITKINGNSIKIYEDLQEQLSKNKGEDINIEVKRGNEVKEFTIKPTYDKEQEKYIMGITFKTARNLTVGESFTRAGNQMVSFTKLTFKTLGNLVTGHGNFKTDLGGPVTIVRLSVESAQAGWINLIYLVAVISLQLAIFNLIPFPALDGGSITIYLIELITGKRFKIETIQKITSVGFALLMGLMLLVTIKDIFFPVSLQ